ncbi:MAG: acs [Pedosphaera sp.]|nr:acs [Pedosphaera sp.]
MNSLTSERLKQPDAAWTPAPGFIETTNVAWLMRQVGADSYEALHKWSVQNRGGFWKLAIERLGIHFQKPFGQVMDLSGGVENPRWLVDAQFNIVDSCFTAPPDSPAIIHQAEGGDLKVITVAELSALVDRVAVNIRYHGFKPNDALGLIMPMTAEAVAIYLGIIKAGCAAVGIADSFRPKEIATRLRLSQAVAVFTQDVIVRGGKTFPLYANVVEAGAPTTIVLPAKEGETPSLREGDHSWRDFLESRGSRAATMREPADAINILFSSGTTGDPKAIPWTQTTPIKCAMDAHFHQNVQPGDVLVWPTNLGWMMGPWLVFAALINKATMGLYYGAPTGRAFGSFVQAAKTTMLGVVPSLVRTWRNSGCMENLDWNMIKVFSSTGECSSADDMRWLMSLAGGKPVIEYCGGTEIGGGYITGTVTQPCVPGAFNTPALGLDFRILDEAGNSAETGELFIVPPSIGLSTTLLNQSHHEIYHADTPQSHDGSILRRHGDQMEKLAGGFWRGLGRADDTMNLGGIKVSSAEIEEVLQTIPGIKEAAAIGVSTSDGPSQLVVYAVCSEHQNADKNALMISMQNAIRRDLNPLFKIQDLVVIDTLPRTASNKIMRRALRDEWKTSQRKE